jgi:hypothetical protein
MTHHEKEHEKKEVSEEEIESTDGAPLPDREAMSIVTMPHDPGMPAFIVDDPDPSPEPPPPEEK